jgi:hypothetical protein
MTVRTLDSTILRGNAGIVARRLHAEMFAECLKACG